MLRVSKPSKQQVNQLGQTLTSLEELKPQANEGQRMAIENARPHLADGTGIDPRPSICCPMTAKRELVALHEIR